MPPAWLGWPRAARARPREDKSTVSPALGGSGCLSAGAALVGLAAGVGRLVRLDDVIGFMGRLLSDLLLDAYRPIAGILEWPAQEVIGESPKRAEHVAHTKRIGPWWSCFGALLG